MASKKSSKKSASKKTGGNKSPNPRKKAFTTRELPIKTKSKIRDLSSELEKNADELDKLLKPGEYIILEIGGKTEKGKRYVGRPAKAFANFRQVAKHFQVDSINIDKKKGRRKTLQEQKSLIDNLKFIKFKGSPTEYRSDVLADRREKAAAFKAKQKADLLERRAEKKELKELRKYKQENEARKKG